MPARRDPSRVKLQPADAFDLIRWLARSQSDPRKAVAELVQNAIDANARHATIERRRRGRRAILVVRDDGDGIRPTEEREAALRYIATHIGRSQKRNLSARERHEQVIAGQYGIGLLGFWSIGRRMEIRSRVAGSATWLLRLVEDDPRADVLVAPAAMDEATTYTELAIGELHAAATRSLAPRRLAEYLGAELRGPLLASGIAVEVREYDHRGQVLERVPVVPRRFEGTRLDVPTRVAVPGYTPIGVELYHSVGASGVELTCAGTVVVERLGELAALDLDREPWTNPALTGTIEFAGLAVPPGTRRGVIPDAAAAAFVMALAQLAPVVQRALDRHLEQRQVATERQLLVELRRALRGLRDRVPHAGLATPLAGRGGAGGDRDPDPLGTSIAPGSPVGEPADDDHPEAPGDDALPPTLLPPGPAAHVAISPDPIRLWPGGARRVRATAHDLHGQRIAADWSWVASASEIDLDGEGATRVVRLSDACDAKGLAVTVTATANGGMASAIVAIALVDGPPAGGPGSGIPEPILVEDAGATWRSRTSRAGWEINIGHPDYQHLGGDPRARLRYTIALFAKELTVSATHPANDAILDQMIDVIAHAERNLLRR